MSVSRTMRLTVGADPEFPIYNTATSKYVAVQSISDIAGTKYDPQYLSDGIGLMKDNVAVEFSMPPANNLTQFVKSITAGKHQINRMLSPHDCVLRYAPSVVFDSDQLLTKEAQEFGCSADYNAWMKEKNSKPCATNQNLRSFGAHLHFGTPDRWAYLRHVMGKVNAVRWLDATVGIALTRYETSDAAKTRRELYGKAGCYRPKKYGVEYRTPSNWWAGELNRTKFVYKLANIALLSMDQYYDKICQFVGINGDKIQGIINDGDSVKAKHFMKHQVLHGFIGASSRLAGVLYSYNFFTGLKEPRHR